MGYLATEIIVLLGGAAVLGLIIGWALFGLGKKPVAAGATAAMPNTKVDAELKAERDGRKRAEGRIFELEAKETNFNERLQERDSKVAELSHQLDDLSKYRVTHATELDSRDQRIAGLETQLRQRDADLQRVAGGLSPQGDAGEKLADRDRLIAKMKADLEAAQAAASPDGGRLRELERENAELRQTLIATDGAAPTTATEKDAIIARLNEEVTGLRAAYESAEQALEEQDAAIDKLTRDLQSTQHKLAVAADGDPGKAASGLTPISAVKPRPSPTKLPEPAKLEPPKAEPPKAEPPKAAAPTPAKAPEPMKVEPAKAPAPAKAAEPVKATEPPRAAAPKAPEPAKADVNNEATMAVSLADLVDQIDQKAPALTATTPAKQPEPARVLAKAPEPPKGSEINSEATMAVSLADLVDQIDQKSNVPALQIAPAPSKPAPAPSPAAPEMESTMALSLDALVAAIDAKPAPQVVQTAPKPIEKKPEPPPARVSAPAAPDMGEATVAVSLADLVGQIDAVEAGVVMRLNVTPAPAGALDDLKEIRGIGPATEKRLNSAGIVTWTQMAGLSESELSAVADLLKISVDKIKREQWVEQARALGGKA